MAATAKYVERPPALASARAASSVDEPAAGESLERATRALTQHYAGVIAGECEAVHQFRISIRKLRGLIELYQPFLQQSWCSHHLEELRSLGRSVGALRDLDVLQQNLSNAAGKIDQPLRDALAPLQQALSERRQQQHQQATALLKSSHYEALVRSLSTVPFKQTHSMDERPAVPKLIRPLVRNVERAGAKLDRGSSPGEFHRLRVKIKRLRYALEVLDGGKPKHRTGVAKKLKSAQDVLGAQHDLVTAMGWLREFAESASVPGPGLLAAGSLYEVLRRRSLKLSQRAWKKWQAVSAGSMLENLVANFDRAARANDTRRVDAA
jgi:CHAD domain-containing protein